MPLDDIIHSLTESSLNNLRNLEVQVKSRNSVIPFVGAGLSVPYKYPTWPDFLKAEAAQSGDPIAIRTTDELLADLRFEEAAEFLLTMRGADFENTLRDTFGRRSLPEFLPADTAASLLPYLTDGPVLTTNFDCVLEAVFHDANDAFAPVVWGAKADAAVRALQNGRRILIKLHGDAEDAKSRVLTRSEYEVYSDPEHALPRLLRMVFNAFQPLLFLGCSLGVDRTMRVLETISTFPDLRHYAIVEAPRDPSERVAREQELSNRHIDPIWYPHGEHRIVAKLVEHLVGLVESDETGAPRTLVSERMPLYNDLFLGRDREMKAVRQALRSPDRREHCVVAMDGAGKTTFAAAYCYRYRRDYRFILWTAAESREAIEAGLRDAARTLNLLYWDDPDNERVLGAVKRWLAQTKEYLFVFDGVRDYAILRTFLPDTTSGSLLLTSSVHPDAAALPLPLLSDADAVTLLLRQARLADDAPTRSDAAALVGALGRLPVAIAIAADWLRSRPDMTMAEYLSRLRSRPNTSGDDAEYRSTHAAWNAAMDQADQESPFAVALLCTGAFLNPDSIPDEFARKFFANRGAAERNLAILRKYSLISRDRSQDGGTWSIHRLMVPVVERRMTPANQKTRAADSIKHVNDLFPEPDLHNREQCERLLPHALACAAQVARYAFHDAPAWKLLYKTGEYLRQQGRYAATLDPLLGFVAANAEQQFGATDEKAKRIREYQTMSAEMIALANAAAGGGGGELRNAVAMGNIGVEYLKHGKYAAAEPMLRHALEIFERVLGSDHPATTTSLNNLARLLTEQGKYDDAETLCRSALEIRKRVFGEDHPDTATSLNNLADLLTRQGKYDDAEPLFRNALETRKRVLGEDHPDTATCLGNLAVLLTHQGKYEDAEPLYQCALEIRKRVLGEDQSHTATSLDRLASLLALQGKYDDAEPLCRRALEIRERVLGEDHPDTAISLGNLAALLAKQGRYDDAEPLSRRTLGIFERVLGSDHPVTEQASASLAALREGMAGAGK